jgi:hypothetical protein
VVSKYLCAPSVCTIQVWKNFWFYNDLQVHGKLETAKI